MRLSRSNLLLGISALLVLFFLQTSFNKVDAHGNNNSCGTETYTFNDDESNSKVEVDFESHDKQIDVFGRNGWSVIRVDLDVDDDNHSGFWNYSNGPLNNFNPNPGNKIKMAKVVVFKSCPSNTPRPTNTPSPRPTDVPCPTPTVTGTPMPTATNSPTFTPTSTPSVTPEPSPTPFDPCEGECESTPTPTPLVVITPNPDLCLNIDGIQTSIPNDYHLDSTKINCVQFSKPGVSETPNTAQNNIPVGQVLGISTMASTGAFEESLFHSIFAFGTFFTSLGIMKNGKKRS